MDLPLRFTHCVPSLYEKMKCAEHLEIIQDLAPVDSNLNVEVDRLHDGKFKTSIHIKALYGKFDSEACEASLVDSLVQAKNAVLVRIEDWKQWRF